MSFWAAARRLEVREVGRRGGGRSVLACGKHREVAADGSRGQHFSTLASADWGPGTRQGVQNAEKGS